MKDADSTERQTSSASPGSCFAQHLFHLLAHFLWKAARAPCLGQPIWLKTVSFPLSSSLLRHLRTGKGKGLASQQFAGRLGLSSIVFQFSIVPGNSLRQSSCSYTEFLFFRIITGVMSPKNKLTNIYTLLLVIFSKLLIPGLKR